jgi:hypothetical protein
MTEAEMEELRFLLILSKMKENADKLEMELTDCKKDATILQSGS